MSLPPWKPTNEAERVAFIRHVIDALDRQDEWRFNAMGTDEKLEWVQRANALAHEAKKLGFKIDLPKPNERTGPKSPDPASNEFTDFDRAIVDVPRIRSLFKQIWGKRNRMVRPLAEEIAAARWELSEKETVALIDKFQRKG